NRRDFLQAGAALAASTGAGAGATAAPGLRSADAAETGAQTRSAWIARLTRIADPVLTHLANGTLKAQMPCEAAAGSEAARRKFTHLEAFGRLLAGMAPWLELSAAGAAGAGATADEAAETRDRTRYADLARRALISATTPSSPDFLNFSDGGQ